RLHSRPCAGPRASAGSSSEELNGLSLHFGRVLGLAVLIGPLPGLKSAFEINLAAFRKVLAAELSELAPDDDLVPLRAFLFLSRLVGPAFVGRHAEIRHGCP